MNGADSNSVRPTTIGETWMRFWFAPAPLRPLAVVRILTGVLGLVLAWSYADDLQAWFGPAGMIPDDVAVAWRPPWGASLYDAATTPASVMALFAATLLAFACLLVGFGSRLAAVAAAVLWASLLHRGPMLAGPADDCLAVLLWCLAAGPCGGDLSFDRARAARGGRVPPATSPWAGIPLGLLQVHASAITLAALLAQLKGDACWNGTATDGRQDRSRGLARDRPARRGAALGTGDGDLRGAARRPHVAQVFNLWWAWAQVANLCYGWHVRWNVEQVVNLLQTLHRLETCATRAVVRRAPVPRPALAHPV